MGQERRDDGGQVSLVAMGPCGTRFEFRIISWSYILNIVTVKCVVTLSCNIFIPFTMCILRIV